MASRLILVRGILGLAVLAAGRAVAADDSMCETIAEPAARLACYDAAHKHPPVAAAAPAPAAPVAVAVAAPKAVAAVTGAAPAAAEATQAKESRLSLMFGLKSRSDKNSAAVPSVKATVVVVQMRPSGQVITLDNGQVWQIAQYLRDPFVQAHDAVVIDSASLGSFLMARASGGSAVYVKRLR